MTDFDILGQLSPDEMKDTIRQGIKEAVADALDHRELQSDISEGVRKAVLEHLDLTTDDGGYETVRNAISEGAMQGFNEIFKRP